MPETRNLTDIVLIGNATPEICGNQLPSNKQVLQCYFYHTRHGTPKFTAREAATCIVRKCAEFWKYAGIPIVKETHAISKMEKLVRQYKTILKYGSRKGNCVSVQVKEIDFQCMLDDLFDIAHQKHVDVLKNVAATTLLSLHRENGRKGCLNTIIDTGTWVHGTQETEEEDKFDIITQGKSFDLEITRLPEQLHRIY